MAVVRACHACGDYLLERDAVGRSHIGCEVAVHDVAPGVAVQLALVNVYHDFHVRNVYGVLVDCRYAPCPVEELEVLVHQGHHVSVGRIIEIQIIL